MPVGPEVVVRPGAGVAVGDPVGRIAVDLAQEAARGVGRLLVDRRPEGLGVGRPARHQHALDDGGRGPGSPAEVDDHGHRDLGHRGRRPQRHQGVGTAGGQRRGPGPEHEGRRPEDPGAPGGHDPRAGLAATATIGSLRDTGANEPANRADPKAYTEPSAPAIQ